MSKFSGISQNGQFRLDLHSRFLHHCLYMSGYKLFSRKLLSYSIILQAKLFGLHLRKDEYPMQTKKIRIVQYELCEALLITLGL